MSKKMTFLGLLLLAVVVTGYSESGTNAKYISKIELADEARVAKWEIGLSDPASMKDLSLFKSSYTYDEDGIVVKALNADGTEDADTNVVAPGTQGQYTFALKGTLETAFTLDVKATVTDNVKLAAGTTYTDDNGVEQTLADDYAPIQYSLDGTTWMDAQGLEDALNALYSTNSNKNVYAPQTIDAKGETTIYWKWAFDETDTAVATGFTPNSVLDTLLGNDGTLTVSIDMTITAEQSKLDVTHATLD